MTDLPIDGEKPLSDELTFSIAEPKVRRDRNEQTISVSCAFDCYSIPIKIIAPDEIWAQWGIEYEDWLVKNLFIDAESDFAKSILICVSVLSNEDKRNKKELEAYLKEDPQGFMDDFDSLYLSQANGNLFISEDPKELLKHANPVVVDQARGGNPYGLNHWEMAKIRRTARWLYVFLMQWINESERKRPRELTNYLKQHDIILSAGYDGIAFTTKQIVEKHFCISLDSDDPKSFYYSYIAFRSLDHNEYIAVRGSSLDRIKSALKNINYLPIREPFSSIFK